MGDFFKNWPNDNRLLLGRQVFDEITSQGATVSAKAFLVGQDKKKPFENRIHFGWKDEFAKKAKQLIGY